VQFCKSASIKISCHVRLTRSALEDIATQGCKNSWHMY